MHAASANWTKLPTLCVCLAFPVKAESPLAIVTWDVVELVAHNAKAVDKVPAFLQINTISSRIQPLIAASFDMKPPAGL